jgi:pyruvate/2-oxoglutarate dehydrogenase complex dihydrolipoamide dehydrogenase (E3) component
VPSSLIILGGGVVGLEMATAFTARGSDVTVIARSTLLGGLEDFAGEAVGAALTGAGATVLTGHGVEHVARSSGVQELDALLCSQAVRLCKVSVTFGSRNSSLLRHSSVTKPDTHLAVIMPPIGSHTM